MDRTILIVDDDTSLCGILGRFLGNQGLSCVFAHAIADARTILAKQQPDLILMDVNLPDGSGFELTREIRTEHGTDIPIIMLTGRHSEIDVVIGFDQGADDYIAKPFRTAELLARIQAVLRRTEKTPSSPPVSNAEPSQAQFGPWSLDLATRTLTGANNPRLPLTRSEYDLLLYLLKHTGKIVPRERLMAAVIRDEDAGDQALEARVYRLRKKIEADPAKPTLLTTRRGEGYMFAANVSWT